MIQDIYNQNINTLDLREALISDRKDEIAVQKNKEIPKELESISLSTASELLSQIDNLGNALNDIFTTPLDFNQEEKIKEKDLKNQINALNKQSQIQLNPKDEIIAEKITNRIDEIFENGYADLEEADELKSLKARMEEVYSGYEKPELNEDKKKQLDSLYKDLDNLYNVITPSKEDLVRGEQIYKKRAELIDLYEQIKPQEKDSYAQDVKVIQELNTISNQIDNNLNLEGDDPLYFKKRDKLLELLEELAKEKKKPDLESTSLDSLYNRLKYEDKEKVEETQDNTSMNFKLPSKEQLLKAESLFEKKDEIYSKLRENSNNFF